MDQPTDPQRPGAGAAAASSPRRLRPRTIAILGVSLAIALVAGSTVVAWSADARAAAVAAEIDRWHEDHDRAGCELTVRIVRAVALEDRAGDVLEAAADVEHATALLGDRQRTAFAAGRADLLASLAHGEYVTGEDRALAERWTSAAIRTADPDRFDLLGSCTAAARAGRPAAGVASADRIDELERTLRTLGDPRDFDDARIDGLEAAIARLAPSAIALAESRTASDDLDGAYGSVPDDLRGSLTTSEARVAAVLGVLDGEHTPTHVLDLVEGLTVHVASAWAADAWKLEAQGQREAAEARSIAAQRALEAIRDAAPRPITDPRPLPGGDDPRPGPSSPEPVRPSQPPAGTAPTPAPSPTPAPTPEPTPEPDPTPPPEDTEPARPGPPPELSPSPEPSLSPTPDRELQLGPSPSPRPFPWPTPAPTPGSDADAAPTAPPLGVTTP